MIVGIPSAESTTHAESIPCGPIVTPIQLRKGDFEVLPFTAITTLGTPLDVTLQELRIESFFPADEGSDRRIRALAVQRPG